MPRIRNIKPETFDDPDLNALPMAARWLFVGLWTQADRDGRLEDDPRRLKIRLLPYEPDDFPAVSALLDLLCPHFITRYVADDGRNLIQINQFSKHQRFHKDEKSGGFPAPTGKSSGKPGNFPAKSPESGNLKSEIGHTEAGVTHARIHATRPTVEATFPDDDSAAGWLLRSWPVWYSAERHGARIVMREARDWPTADAIVQTWPERDYLEKLARAFLSSTSDKLKWCPERTLAQFVTAAPGIDAWMRAT